MAAAFNEGGNFGHHPAANTEATFTVAADSLRARRLTALVAGYDGFPTAGTLTATLGGTVVRKIEITSPGPAPVGWEIEIPPGDALVMSLEASGDASVSGFIDALVVDA